MSINSISSTNTSASTAHGTSSSALSSSNGLSSVGSSISSSDNKESKGTCSDFFSCILSPFKAIGKFFSNMFCKITNFFKSAFKAQENDAARVTFIKSSLGLLNTVKRDEAMDKFSHISNPKLKLELLRAMIVPAEVSETDANSDLLNVPVVSPETVRAFYDLLPVDTQNHLERHIWIENDRNDNGQGLHFGRNVINENIQSELVLKAINKCLSES